MRENGYLEIVGRVKDMIIRGGENGKIVKTFQRFQFPQLSVFPAEIETVLLKHDSVTDVQVVGVADERLGEEIAAVVKLSNPPETDTSRKSLAQELRTFAKQELASFKIPRYYFFKHKDEQLPLTATGKIQKFKLRDIANEEIASAVFVK